MTISTTEQHTTNLDGSAPRAAYSVSEVARALGKGEGAVRQLIRRGHIPSKRIGGAVMVPAQYLQELAEVPAEGRHE